MSHTTRGYNSVAFKIPRMGWAIKMHHMVSQWIIKLPEINCIIVKTSLLKSSIFRGRSTFRSLYALFIYFSTYWSLTLRGFYEKLCNKKEILQLGPAVSNKMTNIENAGSVYGEGERTFQLNALSSELHFLWTIVIFNEDEILCTQEFIPQEVL